MGSNGLAAGISVGIGIASGFAFLGGLGMGIDAPNDAASRVVSTRSVHDSDVTTSAFTDAELDALDQTITDLYAVISGPADDKRDWDKFRSLFTEHAMMSFTQPTADGFALTKLTPEDYANNIGPRLEAIGFTEKETNRVLERFGSVAHAFSTYHGTAGANPDFEIRGINSIQLVMIGDQWKVHSIAWHQKRDNEDIPAKYSPAPKGEL